MDDQYTIEDNARELGITLTDKDWERINEDTRRIEKNIIGYLEKKYGIKFREEGHSDNELIGTCWLPLGDTEWKYSEEEIEKEYGGRYPLNNKQAKAYTLMMDATGTDVAIDMLASYDGDFGDDLFKGCGRKIRKIVDVYMYFFDHPCDDVEIYENERGKNNVQFEFGRKKWAKHIAVV
jgi:hypothetical protein